MFRKPNVSLTVLLVILMTLGFAACSVTENTDVTAPAQTKSQTATTTSATSAPQEDLLAKTLEISWGGNANNSVEYGGSVDNRGVIQKALEERFNVTLTIVKIDFSSEEKINLMLTSGEGPDVGRLGYTDSAKNYADGVIREIPIEMIKEYAPLYAAYLDTKDAGWNYLKSPDSADCMIGLAGSDDTVMGTYIVPTYRLDWLLNSGCPVQPKGELVDIDGNEKVYYTTEAFTIDELEQIFDYFANGDPDGNGQKDTYGITPSAIGSGTESYTFDTTMGSFGLGNAWDFIYNDEGEAVLQAENPKLKDVIKLLNRWYEKSIIDPEFLTNSFSSMNEKLGNGVAGYANVQISYFNYQNDGLKSLFPANVIATNPDAKILITPPEIGEYQAEQRNYTVSTMVGMDTTVGNKVNDEKLARILMMYDYMNFTDEGYALTRYGIEGDTFEWTGEAFNSAVNWLKPDDPNGYNFFNGGYYTEYYMNINYSDGQKILVDYFQNGDGAKYASIVTYKNDFYNTTNYRAVNQQYGTAIATLYNDFITNGILGRIDVDTEWDSYISNLEASGLNELLAEIEKMPTVEELTK